MLVISASSEEMFMGSFGFLVSASSSSSSSLLLMVVVVPPDGAPFLPRAFLGVEVRVPAAARLLDGFAGLSWAGVRPNSVAFLRRTFMRDWMHDAGTFGPAEERWVS